MENYKIYNNQSRKIITLPMPEIGIQNIPVIFQLMRIEKYQGIIMHTESSNLNTAWVKADTAIIGCWGFGVEGHLIWCARTVKLSLLPLIFQNIM